MKKTEAALRRAIVEQCRWMNAAGLNQGTSGNISARLGARMLITPSATPYDAMTPESLASMVLDDADGAWEGPLKPSTEWRFHRDILRARTDVGAVVHTHSTYATALAMCGKGLPAAHYMVAAFGGADVRCAPYATYGTQALSDHVVAALAGRHACLMANHGMIAVGPTLERAMWRAAELETLAKQYFLTLQIGGPVLLPDAEIATVLQGFASYGAGAAAAKPARRKAKDAG